MKSTRIDKRPLIVLFFLEYKNAFFMLLIFSLFFIFINNPVNIAGLGVEGYRATVIFALAVILWVSNLIPLSITSLMIMGLLATYKVLDTKSIYSFFGNSSVFFIIGAFIISAGVKVSGLSRRVAYYVLGRYGKTPLSLILAVFFLSAILSHIMPEHGVAALMLPILIDISEAVGIKKGSDYGKNLFFSMAWGCITGGVVTYLGGARNPIAVGILNELTGENIDFLAWIKASSIPVYIIIAAITIYFFIRVKKETVEHIEIAEKLIETSLKRLHKLTFREIKAGFILIITIFLWIFYNESLGIANIAILSAALYFLLNVISWDEANREINWGVIFMYGGAISIGSALNRVGVLEWFTNTYLLDLNFTKFTLLAALIIASIFLTELVSNTAVIVILMPVAINLAINLGLSTKVATMAVAIPSGLAFVLPISTPVIALMLTSGYVGFRDLLKRGMQIKILSLILFLISASIYWMVTGLVA